MSFEGDFRALLLTLTGGRVYPDTAPDTAAYPFITYQQVGGESLWFSEKAIPDHKHARIQVNVWSKSRAEANAIARKIEKAICESPFAAAPLGAFVALYESSLKNYGSRQDFSLWYRDP